MLQGIQWNDDEGNQVIAVSEDAGNLMEAVNDYHRESYDEELEWEENPDGSWETPHKYGMQYSIESVKVV